MSEDQVRFSARLLILSADLGIQSITIAGGYYNKFNHTGKLNNMGLSLH